MPNEEAKKKKLLVLGAGELGMAVLRAVARLHDKGRLPPVSVLLRPSGEKQGRPEFADLGCDIVRADLATIPVPELADVFSEFTQVVCCTGFVGGPGTQRRITQAAIESGIDHYIPWQFGVDYDVVGRGSGQDVWDEQLDVRELLRGQNVINWTIVSTGIFTSFVFLPDFGLVDMENRIVRALGDWDYRLTATTPEDIGRLTALVASEHRDFSDQVIYLAGDTFSYRELAEKVERVVGEPFRRELWSVADLKADVADHPDDAFRKYRLSFARPDGVAWPMESTLNDKLGIDMVALATWLEDNQRQQGRH